MLRYPDSGEDTPGLIGPAPEPVSFRIVRFRAGTVFPAQRAAWGKLLYAVDGLAEFTIAGQRTLSPPAIQPMIT